MVSNVTEDGRFCILAKKARESRILWIWDLTNCAWFADFVLYCNVSLKKNKNYIQYKYIFIFHRSPSISSWLQLTCWRYPCFLTVIRYVIPLQPARLVPAPARSSTSFMGPIEYPSGHQIMSLWRHGGRVGGSPLGMHPKNRGGTCY